LFNGKLAVVELYS